MRPSDAEEEDGAPVSYARTVWCEFSERAGYVYGVPTQISAARGSEYGRKRSVRALVWMLNEEVEKCARLAESRPGGAEIAAAIRRTRTIPFSTTPAGSEDWRDG